MKAIEIHSVTKRFGSVAAVRDLSLELDEGGVLGFIGTNGAGKTTTVKMLLGLIAPDAGTVRAFGGDPRDAVTRRRIGYMPETANYYPYLKIGELLEFYGGLCGMTGASIRARSAELIRRVGLDGATKRPLKTFSKGMLQRAGLAQALLPDPDLLVLDEPFTGLDPLARVQLRELVRECAARGKTVFFSSHELGETELLCDRVVIMKDGASIYDGPSRELAGTGEGNLERLFLKVLGENGKGGAK